MLRRDKINKDLVLLFKYDGHLGALFDPKRQVVRFISRDGGATEHNLAEITELFQQEEAQRIVARE